MLAKSLTRNQILQQVNSASFTTASWFQSLKATAVSLFPRNDAYSEDGTKQKIDNTSETQINASVSPSVYNNPAVSLILDRFHTSNNATSVQLLAELGSHFPEAKSLTQFHLSQSVPSGELENQKQLGDLQSRFVQQLPPLAALDVYKALAALRLRPSEEIHDFVFNSLIKNSEDLNIAQLASFLQARLLLAPDQGYTMMTAMGDILSEALKKSKKRQLQDASHVVHILKLFAKHKIQNSTSLIDMIEFLRGRIQGLSNGELVEVISYLTELDRRDEKLYDSIVMEVLHRGADKFHTSDISSLAASLTLSDHFDVMTDVLLDSFAMSCQGRIQKLKFEELVNILWAYSHHMHFHHDGKLLTPLINGLMDKLPKTEAPNGRTLVKLCEIIAATDVGTEMAAFILETVSKQSSETFAALGKQDLLCILESCTKNKFRCDNLLTNLKKELLTYIEDLTSSELCSLINSSAVLNFNPGEELLNKVKTLTTNYQQMNPTQTCRTIWSLVYFDLVSCETGAALFNHLSSFSRSQFNVLDVQKALLSEKLLLLKENQSNQLIPEPLRSEIVQMWRKRIDFTRSISRFQQEIQKVLTRLSVTHEAEALIDNGELSVDFVISLSTPNSPERVILECDGPRRRSINFPYQSLGQTLTFKRLLKAQGWKVIVVTKLEWQKKSASEQEEYLKSLLGL